MVRQLILHAHRNFVVLPSTNNSVFLKMLEGLGQHHIGDTRNTPLNLIIA